MPNIELGAPYKTYIDSVIASGLYSTATEVIKDALRKHMEDNTEAKRRAYILAAIAEGEADIAAGRYVEYTPDLLDQITAEVLSEADE